MEKELLENSKNQNNTKDLYEYPTISNGIIIVYAVGILLACILYGVELIWKHLHNYSLIAVWFAMHGTLMVYQYVTFKKVYELVFGIIILLCSLGFIIFQVLKLAELM